MIKKVDNIELIKKINKLLERRSVIKKMLRDLPTGENIKVKMSFNTFRIIHSYNGEGVEVYKKPLIKYINQELTRIDEEIKEIESEIKGG